MVPLDDFGVFIVAFCGDHSDNMSAIMGTMSKMDVSFPWKVCYIHMLQSKELFKDDAAQPRNSCINSSLDVNAVDPYLYL